MKEYIEREAVKEKLSPMLNDPEAVDFWEWQCSEIDDIHAADVREVVKAQWQSWTQEKPPCKWYSCDYCGYHALNKSNFCPNCGADMRREIEHETNSRRGNDGT